MGFISRLPRKNLCAVQSVSAATLFSHTLNDAQIKTRHLVLYANDVSKRNQRKDWRLVAFVNVLQRDSMYTMILKSGLHVCIRDQRLRNT